MRRVRSVETRVLGYLIERLDHYDATGMLQSHVFEVQCPHTGRKLGRHANLRMAKRAVILHELRGITLKRRREREHRRQHATEAAA